VQLAAVHGLGILFLYYFSCKLRIGWC